MHIGIDGNEANIAKRVGIGEYAFELLSQFHKILQVEKAHKVTVYLKHTPIPDMPFPYESWNYKIVRPAKLWTQFGLPFHLFFSGSKPDIFFTPTHYSPRFSPVPTVVSIMDLSFIHFPELFAKSDLYQLKNWTAYSVQKAHKVFTISEASKSDIIKEYGKKKDDIIVIYPGIKPLQSLTPDIYSMNALKTTYGISDSYILFVGTLQPRKNIIRLIEAFKKASQKHDKLQLLIVGKKGWLFEEILKAPQKYDVERSVKFLDYVSNEDLALLYKNALCFILPSLYEGFGLPVLEAMKNGCPVITSNISSLPEAAGDAALYVDPTDTNDIADKLKKVIENQKLRSELIKKGYEQVKKFSWEQSAKKTLQVLEEVVKTEEQYER